MVYANATTLFEEQARDHKCEEYYDLACSKRALLISGKSVHMGFTWKLQSDSSTMRRVFRNNRATFNIFEANWYQSKRVKTVLQQEASICKAFETVKARRPTAEKNFAFMQRDLVRAEVRLAQQDQQLTHAQDHSSAMVGLQEKLQRSFS